MVDSLYHRISLLFFDSPLLYYYVIILILDHQPFSLLNLRSSMILCLSSGSINLSLSISFSFASDLFFGEAFETPLIFSAISF